MRALQFRTVGAFGWNFALNATGFINRVKEISGEIVKRLLRPTRPRDLYNVHQRISTQTKMHPKVVLRKKAPTAANFV